MHVFSSLEAVTCTCVCENSCNFVNLVPFMRVFVNVLYMPQKDL